MPRICPRVDFGRTPFEMTDQLQNPAEAECDAVLEDPYRLRTKHFGVPASSLLECAARHRDVRDVASRSYPGRYIAHIAVPCRALEEAARVRGTAPRCAR